MFAFLYTVVVFPIIQILELTWLFVYRIFDNPGLALLGLSAAVSAGTLPFYLMAEKYQQAERNIQKKLKPKVDKIKKGFRGDERFMILSTYYRQNHYHPVYALRSTLGLLIQIPFFIAAYSFLSHLEAVQGVSFLYITDLGTPDALLAWGGVQLNLLPILMTLINCISGAVYTRNLGIRDKIQIYGTAAVFLVLLYNAPAGLVLYWTANNVFSLIKNCCQRIDNSKKVIYPLICLGVILFDIYVLFFHPGYLPKRILVSLAFSCILFFPALLKLYVFAKNKLASTALDTAAGQNRTFIVSSLITTLLTGLVIPSALIASSVQEFSFIESYKSPFPFILNTQLQAIGIFLFWPLCIYFLFSKKVKILLTLLMSLFFGHALINAFFFPGNYGVLLLTFTLTNPGLFNSDYGLIIYSTLSAAAVTGVFVFLLFYKRSALFRSLQTIVLIALIGLGAFNVAKIHREFTSFAARNDIGRNNINRSAKTPEAVYEFSQKGKNVLVIMLDRGISGYVPYMFREKPELAEAFSGFTWYPNCVSFGGHTLIGVPPIFGGYEYTPLEMRQKVSETLIDKHNQALLVLPKLFSDRGFSATITNPSFANYSWIADLSIFDDYPQIHAENTIQSLSVDYWLSDHKDLELISFSTIIHNNLIRFSFFKSLAPLFRIWFYDRGNWTTTKRNYGLGLPLSTLLNYADLDHLPGNTKITDDNINTFTMLVNELTHEPVFFQIPDYTPATTVLCKAAKTTG
jgi:YidC/Oxa1 family membrane protein insertase